LNIAGDCGCPPCGAPSSPPISKIYLYNQRSVCKIVSQCADILVVCVNVNSLIEYDLNRYCIDSEDIPLDKVIILDLGTEGPAINLYIDLDFPGGIQFTCNGKACNVEFAVNQNMTNHAYFLNYGSILDPVELTNLKCALSLDPCYPCPRFKNPFDTKITNTYLRGGDRVRFIVDCGHQHRLAITPDVPTVFRLNRRVLDIGVGYNNLSILVGGLACPNEIFAIGRNCHGELGIGSNESIVCFRQLNRCLFDCQVSAIFSGKYVTFYVTQSGRVYGSGQWKCLVDSNLPNCIPSINQCWKVKDIAISQNQIVILGQDGCIYGVGDNSLGELGLCHLECVLCPVPLIFFYKLNQQVAKSLCDSLRHPVERNYQNSRSNTNSNSNSTSTAIVNQITNNNSNGNGNSNNNGYGNQINNGFNGGRDGWRDGCDDDCGPVRYLKRYACGRRQKYIPNGRCGR